jgi:hypothetical protein
MTALNALLILMAVASLGFLLAGLYEDAQYRRLNRRDPQTGYVRANRP